MVRDVSNAEDVIDSRDVIERIQELDEERADLASAADEAEGQQAKDEAREALRAWDEDNAAELEALKALAEEAEGYCEDWRHGATLIRDTYFVDYCRDLLDDLGELPKDLPHYVVIDWNATADNLRADYTEVDYDGVTYLVR